MSLLCAVCLHTPPGDTDTHRARTAITIMRGLAVCEPHLELFELPGDIWDALMLTAEEERA